MTRLGSSSMARLCSQATAWAPSSGSGQRNSGNVFFLVLTYVFQPFFPETRVETQGRKGEKSTVTRCPPVPGGQESHLRPWLN